MEKQQQPCASCGGAMIPAIDGSTCPECRRLNDTIKEYGVTPRSEKIWLGPPVDGNSRRMAGLRE